MAAPAVVWRGRGRGGGGGSRPRHRAAPAPRAGKGQQKLKGDAPRWAARSWSRSAPGGRRWSRVSSRGRPSFCWLRFAVFRVERRASQNLGVFAPSTLNSGGRVCFSWRLLGRGAAGAAPDVLLEEACETRTLGLGSRLCPARHSAAVSRPRHTHHKKLLH